MVGCQFDSGADRSLKLGLPIITHICSARGYDAFEGTPFLKSFNDGIEFGRAVEYVSKNVTNMSPNEIIEKYKDFFSYTEGKKRLNKIFECKTYF